MKKLGAILSSSAVLCGSLMLADEPTATATLKDTGQALINPAMGWTMHFYSNVPRNYGSKLDPSDSLPLDGDDGQHRYKIGSIALKTDK